MASDKPNNLYGKMAWVMSQVSRLKKTGKHPKHGYAFATDADVSDLIRELLAEAGLAFFPAMVARQEQIGTTSSGAPVYRTYADFQMTFACGDSGQVFTCAWASESDDMQDKGFNKAATAGVKYFLLKTFLVSTGDSVDPDGTHVEIEQSARPNNSAKPGEPINTEITHVEIRAGNQGKPYLYFITKDNQKFSQFTRKPFIDAGWIEDSDWKDVAPTRKLDTPIPAVIQHDGQYWQLVEVSPVVF